MTPRKPARELTPAERAARAERARENGRKGGRPPSSPWNPIQRACAQAREKGAAVLPFVVDYLIEIVRGEHEDATHDHRIRAAEFLANRCGLPVSAILEAAVNHNVRTVNALGWRDPQGVLRAADGMPVEDGAPDVN